MSAATPQLRVAVVGGGIVGLSLAVFLTRIGKVDLQIYEAAAAFAEIGAGIGLGPNAQSVYKEEGLYDDCAKLGIDRKNDEWLEFRFGDREGVSDVVCPARNGWGQSSLSLHRAQLLDFLIERLPKEDVHFRKQLSYYEQGKSGPVILHFSDGSIAETDVLVGADGIRSNVRRCMYGGRQTQAEEEDLMEPQWTGTIAYRGLIPMKDLKAAIGEDLAMRQLCWMGLNKHLIVFPVQQNRTVNVVVFVSDRSKGRNPKWPNNTWVEPEVPQSEMLAAFEGWVEPVVRLLQLIKKPSKWALFEVPKLPHFVDGKVALIGDAAHGMLPHQGNGASQGIEDAYILAHLLSYSSVNPTNVDRALLAYEKCRKERAQRVQQTSYEAGMVYELVSPCGADPDKIAKDLAARYTWIWDVDVKDELRKALQSMETL